VSELHVEIVDPLAYAEAASGVLRAAWVPPCMHYSAAYVSWQLRFPDEGRAKLAVAFVKGLAIGCAAVTPRRLAQAGAFLSAYVLSFVAVDPSVRGQGVAGALYQSLLDALQDERPVIAFAVPGSSGERLLLRAFERAAFTHRPLRQCRAAGFVPRPAKTDREYSVDSDSGDFALACTEEREPTIMFNAPTTDQLKHYRSDPRGRSLLLIRRPDGQPAATAMSVTAEIHTTAGLERVLMLESLKLFEPSADALRATFTFALQRGEGATSVMASNVSHLEDEIVKGSGARLLPSAFNAHLFAKSPASHVATVATNLEVI
jgi:GNAT superfamily N-acetyltransferase